MDCDGTWMMVIKLEQTKEIVRPSNVMSMEEISKQSY